MFFIRLAFWLGVVVMLLPTDQQQQARLYTTATTAVERVTTFCDRNARTCTVAAETWATFLRKAEFGARLLGDLVSSAGRNREPDTPSAPARSADAETRGTLSLQDMQPAWRGPSPRWTGT